MTQSFLSGAGRRRAAGGLHNAIDDVMQSLPGEALAGYSLTL